MLSRIPRQMSTEHIRRGCEKKNQWSVCLKSLESGGQVGAPFISNEQNGIIKARFAEQMAYREILIVSQKPKDLEHLNVRPMALVVVETS